MKKNVFSVRRLCSLSLLTAITIILAVFATFRIGNQIKVPMKFITVFLTGALYGPLAGGLVGAVADLMNAYLVPVGPPLIRLTLSEFVHGALYGIFFYKSGNNRSYYVRAVLCSGLILLTNIFYNSTVLASVGIFPDFKTAVIVRMPAMIFSFAIQVFCIIILKKAVFLFKLKEGKKN